MAEASCPRASRYVFRVRGRVGSGHQVGARAAGFTGNTSQSALLTYWTFKSRLQAFAMKLVGKALVGEKGQKASDAIGTLHVAHFVPFEKNHLGFFTIFDGDFAKYIQDFADKDLVRFRHALSTCRWRAANPSSKERPGVLSVGIGKQPSGDRVLQRLSRPLGSRHSSPDGRPQVTTGHHSIAVVERRSMRSAALAKRKETQGETR